MSTPYNYKCSHIWTTTKGATIWRRGEDGLDREFQEIKTTCAKCRRSEPTKWAEVSPPINLDLV